MVQAGGGDMFRFEDRAAVPYISCELLRRWGGVQGAFTTRRGGVSRGPFATLNLSFRVGDDPEHTATNRARAWEALGLAGRKVVSLRQVHGRRVVVAHGGCGEDGSTGADALVTAEPGIALAVFCADCAPVFLLDPARRAIGLAHAGWRGTVAGVVGNTVKTMRAVYGSSPEDLVAAVGPSIGPCCYQVGMTVADEFRRRFGQPVVLPREGKLFVDLWAALAVELADAGVPRQRIAIARLCTCCDAERFFSHRRDGAMSGRMAAVMYL